MGLLRDVIGQWLENCGREYGFGLGLGLGRGLKVRVRLALMLCCDWGLR